MSRTAAAARAFSRRESLLADASLVLVTLIWGTSFPMMKGVLAEFPPFPISTIRLAIATLGLLAVARERVLRLDRAAWGGAALIALTLGAGFLFQIAGLVHTTPINSAFLTSLSVPIVPFASLWVLRSRPPLAAWIGCGLAFGGSLLLTWQPGVGIGPGDSLTIVCAAFWGLEIVLISKYTAGRDVVAMTAAFCAIATVLSLATWIVSGQPAPPLRALPWPTLLYLGLVVAAATLLIQSLAQQHTSAVHTAVIFALEPLWAALFSWLWIGETMGPRALAGSGAILAGILVSELTPPQRPVVAAAGGG